MEKEKNISMGHDFLKFLGRTKLRPGGGVVTKWLLEQVEINNCSKVLEVACNQGDNLISLYNKYKCKIIGIDLDEGVIETCKENLEILGFNNDVEVLKMNATNLDFKDESFDLVLNEAMLTMLSDDDKKLALKEYLRVLKPGGKLIIHDVAIEGNEEELRKKVSIMANINACPLSKFNWVKLLEEMGFEVIAQKHGGFLLLDKETIIEDEGAIGAVNFYKNANKEEFKERIAKMKKRSENTNISYIGIVARKGI
ncbi:class I SAM-dependent methyltransferase [Peptoniphilus sp. SGI.035]|uniref:class I SAM-dependent methyltransferase n=1 Tax=Peptoniphilus sp. SGI.035 TaxID=3420564 RepID=UPI003D071106